jgi:sugar O-acyltransferase (sialic acid O-acetyltransferase NeuD family)
MNKKLLIIGASGHGKVVADIAIKMNKWKYIGFLDDNGNINSSMGLDVVGKSSDSFSYIADFDIIVGIGNNQVREKIQKKLEDAGANIPVLIHPNAIIGQQVEINPGTVIMAGVIINCYTRIGSGCIINTGVTVDHDNVLQNFVHLSPGVHLAGAVEVGQGSWLGVGSVVSNNVRISEGCIIGAGAVVIKDISETGTYVGVPVRRVSR